MPREVSPSDRMQIVNIGELLAPGSCMVCGNGTTQEGFLRLGVFFAHEGEMYLCMACLIEAAETGGMLSVDEAALLLKQASDTADLNAKLKTELEEANGELSIYRDAFRLSSVSVSGGNGATPKSIHSDTEAGNSKTIKDESVLTKPVKDDGFNQPELFEPSNSGIEL